MIFNSFSIGKDMALSIQLTNILNAAAPTGSPLQTAILKDNDLGLLDSFSPNIDMAEVRKIPINRNGVPCYRTLMHGWNGSFAFTRQSPALEFLAQLLQNNFYAGGGQVLANIQQTIYHPNGMAFGHVTWAFNSAVLLPESGGNFESEQGVVQNFKFHCGYRDLVEMTEQFAGQNGYANYADLVNNATLLGGQLNF